jgi:hypothetical protein
MPSYLRLDLADNCNIRCVMCKVYNSLPVSAMRFMDFDVFVSRTRGQLSAWSHIQLGNATEATIHPRFAEFLRYIRNRPPCRNSRRNSGLRIGARSEPIRRYSIGEKNDRAVTLRYTAPALTAAKATAVIPALLETPRDRSSWYAFRRPLGALLMRLLQPDARPSAIFVDELDPGLLKCRLDLVSSIGPTAQRPLLSL